MAVMVQFCVVPIRPVSTFDGGLIVYFHIFKQFLLIGFVMAATRKKAAPVMYNYYPIAFLLLVACAPPTNFYRSGQTTYPYFPYTQDRLMWTGGAVLQMFIHDRA